MRDMLCARFGMRDCVDGGLARYWSGTGRRVGWGVIEAG
jgi:hypothetical protein